MYEGRQSDQIHVKIKRRSTRYFTDLEGDDMPDKRIYFQSGKLVWIRRKRLWSTEAGGSPLAEVSTIVDIKLAGIILLMTDSETFWRRSSSITGKSRDSMLAMFSNWRLSSFPLSWSRTHISKVNILQRVQSFALLGLLHKSSLRHHPGWSMSLSRNQWKITWNNLKFERKPVAEFWIHCKPV